MPMAADKRQKCFNATSIVGCGYRGQCGAEDKNMELPQSDLNLKSHILLEWDDKQNIVVPKREQICISWRYLSPYFDSAPRCHNILGDVLAVPSEIFELDELIGVLSYEVWRTHLSENERNLLTQFLPKGVDRRKVVQELLAGDNLHFGNPFLKWGASVCSGNFHPDKVIYREHCFKAKKKAYYLELQRYHNDTIGIFQSWKERWASCKDPEKEIVQKMWRSRKHVKESLPLLANGITQWDREEYFAANTSESCSWIADEKACSSDNQNSVVKESQKLQKRSKCKNELTAPDGLKVAAKPRKGEKLHKFNTHNGDVAKYMSCIKISKQQHQLIKSLKQSGNSIQSRSLNRVLGNLSSFHVQPYEVFEEEEQKKLHEYWLQLAIGELPKAYMYWSQRKMHRQQIKKSLEQELDETLKPPVVEESLNLDVTVLEERKDNRTAENEVMMESNEEPVPESIGDQQIPSLECHDQFNSLNNHVTPNNIAQYSRDLNPAAEVAVSQGVPPISSARDDWPTVSMSDPYYHSRKPMRARIDYDYAGNLSLGYQISGKQPSHLIDLETHMPEREDNIQKDGTVFGSYPSQDRHELLQSLFGNQVLTEPSALAPGHFGNQVQLPLLLDQRQKVQDSLLIHQNIQENIFSDGGTGRYVIPRADHFSPVHMQDWPINSIAMSAPPQPRLNGLGQNWFPAEHRAHDGGGGGWTCLDGGAGILSQHGIGNGNNVADESLFSVLSHCSAAPFDPIMPSSSQQLMESRNYGSSSVMPQTASTLHPFNYLRGHEQPAPALLKNHPMGWMSMPHQNSALHDSMGKPYLRSWNQ